MKLYLLSIIFVVSSVSYGSMEARGTLRDPLVISTAQELFDIAHDSNSYDKHIVLSNDIDLIKYGQFKKPLFSRSFNGVFDGKGYVIKNLNIENWDGDKGRLIGLFGTIGSNGLLCNIGIQNSNVSGHLSVGILAAVNHGRIVNCRCEGHVQANHYAGGLVGSNWGDIFYCRTNTIVESKMDGCGGLIGIVCEGRIRSCWSQGDIVNGLYSGGLVGRILNDYSEPDTVHLQHVFSHCSVKGAFAGGLVGYVQGKGNVVADAYVTGSISGIHGVGGIIGTVWASGIDVQRCLYAHDTTNKTALKNGYGQGVFLEEMKDINTFRLSDWRISHDVESTWPIIWKLDQGEYPTLVGPVQLEGVGDQKSPYHIRNAADFVSIRYNPTSHFRIMSDITFKGHEFSGAVVPDFRGHLDGNFHKLLDVVINSKRSSGLFGTIKKGASITSLSLEKARIHGSYLVGAIAATNHGVLHACSTFGKGSIRETSVSEYSYVGGLVGDNTGTILYSLSDNRIWGQHSVGGFVARNSGQIINCYSISDVMGNKILAGFACSNGGAVENCFFNGTVGQTHQAYGFIAGGKAGKKCFWNRGKSQILDYTEEGAISDYEMRQRDTFIERGWDFEDENENGFIDTWKMSTTHTNPVLVYRDDIASHLNGAGTHEDPYRIYTPEQLRYLNYECWQSFQLEANIDLLEAEWKQAIIPYFDGQLNGNGYSINNLQIVSSHDLIGLFGKLDTNAIISHVMMNNAYIAGRNFVAIITGENCGDLIGCFTSGEVLGCSSVGGMVGINNNGRISLCDNEADVVSEKGEIGTSQRIGGLIGNNYKGIVSECSSKGKIGSQNSNTCGGLVGYNDEGWLWHCSVLKGTKVFGASSVGGFIGVNEKGYIAICESDAEINYCSNYVGGLIGKDYMGVIERSSSNGKIKQRWSYSFPGMIGGLIGSCQDGTILNCFSHSSTYDAYRNVGGFIGYANNVSVLHSYSSGHVEGELAVGGFIGSNMNYDLVENCYWDLETSGTYSSSGGIPMTTLEMMDAWNYFNWDFENVWELKNGQYPMLRQY